MARMMDMPKGAGPMERKEKKAMGLSDVAKNIQKTKSPTAPPPAAPEPQKEEKPGFWDKYGSDVALTTLPTLIGAAFGGYEGGAIGAEAGMAGLKELRAGREKEAMETKAAEEKRQAAEAQLAKERGEEEKWEKEYRLKSIETESQRRLRAAQAQKAMAEAKKKDAGAQPAGYQQKIEKLGAEERKRLDNIIMGKAALKDMSKAFAEGYNTFTMIGDNPFTFAANRWNEAIGRMQSGGAINKEEAANFRRLVPSWSDSKEMQLTKLQKMGEEMDRRLQSFGMSPYEVPGYEDGSQEAYMQAYKDGNSLLELERAKAAVGGKPLKDINAMSRKELEAELNE